MSEGSEHMTEKVRIAPLTVGRLREHIADLPDRYEVLIETIVGGDLVTDDVALMDVALAGHQDVYVRLVPDPCDDYRTRELIDDGIAFRDAVEAILDEHGDCFDGKPIHQVEGELGDQECVDECTGCCADDVVTRLRTLITRPA